MIGDCNAKFTLIAFCLGMALPHQAWSSQEEKPQSRVSPTLVVEQTEQQLLAGFAALQNLQLDQSIEKFSELAKQTPNYRLAQMLKADLLSLKAGQSLQQQSFRQHYPKTIAALKKEAQVRWQFSQSEMDAAPVLRQFLLKDAGQPYVVLVDIVKRRLHLYQNTLSGWQKLDDFYISIGSRGTEKRQEGDKRTPLGVYLIADQIQGKQLPDFYGPGALPINYPNVWDRHLGRTGSGIWLHGVPSDTYARNPDASRGCVVLSNDAVLELIDNYSLPLSTPVILWDSAKAYAHLGDDELALQTLKSQLADVQSQVNWSDITVYRYPNEDNLWYLTFPAKEPGVLIHQFWQYSPSKMATVQNNMGVDEWQLKTQRQLPIEIKYVFQ